MLTKFKQRLKDLYYYIFNPIETDDEIATRVLELAEPGDYGIFSPPLDAQVALNELCRYFLGDDWYSVGNITTSQVNTEIVYEIERHYKGKRQKNKFTKGDKKCNLKKH